MKLKIQSIAIFYKYYATSTHRDSTIGKNEVKTGHRVDRYSSRNLVSDFSVITIEHGPEVSRGAKLPIDYSLGPLRHRQRKETESAIQEREIRYETDDNEFKLASTKKAFALGTREILNGPSAPAR